MVINLIIGCSPVLERKRSTCKKTLDLTKTLDPQFDVHDATYSISTLLQPNPDFSGASSHLLVKLVFIGSSQQFHHPASTPASACVVLFRGMLDPASRSLQSHRTQQGNTQPCKKQRAVLENAVPLQDTTDTQRKMIQMGHKVSGGFRSLGSSDLHCETSNFTVFRICAR